MDYLTRRSFSGALAAFASCAATFSFQPGAQAQEYPNKPIHMVIPWPAGGTTDILGRALGEDLGKQLGQPVVIDNKGGAAGKIGTEFAARSAADGYTIFLGTPANFSVAAAYEKSLPYDPDKDFAPVAYLGESPAMLVVSSSLPIHNISEMREYEKTAGRRLSFASAGEGSSYHLMGELFKLQTKIDLLHVPFVAAPQASTAVASNEVDMVFGAGGLRAFIELGKVRPVAVTGDKEWSIVPGVATFNSQGVNDLVGAWFAIFVPAGTPQDVIDKLNAAVNKSISSPKFKEVLDSNGFIPVGGTPSELADMVAKDTAIWKSVVEQANLRRP